MAVEVVRAVYKQLKSEGCNQCSRCPSKKLLEAIEYYGVEGFAERFENQKLESDVYNVFEKLAQMTNR